MLRLDREFLEAYAVHKDIVYTATVTLANGTVITLDEDDFVSGGCGVLRDNGADVLPLGYVYCAQLTLSIYDKPEFNNIDFFNATVIVTGVYSYNSKTFTFSLGQYTITEPTISNSIIQLVGYDDIYKTDKPCEITGSRKATTLFEECCYNCGVNYDTDRVFDGLRAFPEDWDTNNIVIQSIPSGLSCRQVMGMVAMFFGANVYISPFDNYVYVLPLTLSSGYEASYWGGVFDASTPYATGDIVNGGTFNPWADGDAVDAGDFSEDISTIYFTDPASYPVLSTVENAVDGVRTNIEDTEYSYPLSGEGYLLSITNDLMTGQEQTLINTIGAAVEGVVFRTFSLDYSSFPFADLMQKAAFIDRQDRTNMSMLTHIDIQLKGLSHFKCSGDTQSEADAKDSYRSAYKIASNAIQKANHAITQARSELTAYDEEVQRLAKLIANTFGAFETEETLPGGGKVFYMHDKPALADSQTIWRRTVEGFMVSTDGGQTWNAGMDASGNVVANILSVIGLYADWIKTGTISSRTGGSSWNLDAGIFETTDGSQTVRISDGGYRLYDTYGSLRGKIWLSPDGTTGVEAFAIMGRPNMTIGYISDDLRNVYVIYINTDPTGETVPGGYGERVIIYSSVRMLSNVYMDSGVTVSDVSHFKGSMCYESPTGDLRLKITHASSGGVLFSLGDSEDDLLFCVQSKTSTSVRECFRISRVSGHDYECELHVPRVARFTNDLYYTTLVQISDERLKDIQQWDTRYDDIFPKLSVIDFLWNSGDANRHHIGFSAQQIQRVLDELGIRDSGLVTDNDTPAIEYNGIVALLVKRVQEQEKKISELEKRLEKLERMMT